MNHKVQVALVAETWFTAKHCDAELNIDGFLLFRRDRSRRKGGGVCAYVDTALNCEPFSPCDNDNLIEVMWLKICICSQLYFVACAYHPPKPKYNPHKLIDELVDGIDFIIQQYCSPIIIIAGDFNQLDTSSLQIDFGLSQIVSLPTHKQNLIDKVFTNRADLYEASVFKSLVKTKHMAVLISKDSVDDKPTEEPNSKHQLVSSFDLRSHNIDKLRYVLGTFDWSYILSVYDVCLLYDMFLSTVRHFCAVCIPIRRVRVGSRDPPYLTPLVKTLLVKRNKLRKQGSNIEADQLAERINQLIADQQGKSLAKLADAGPKQLWKAVKPQRRITEHSRSSVLIDADVVNNFFASIATDLDYSADRVLQFRQDSEIENGRYTCEYITCYEVEILLRTLKNTAPGCDSLPSWLFRSCSYELAAPIAHIYNCSIHSGLVPNPWKTAVVTPVPKVSRPASLGEYRPISVTPILSRIAEKFIVRKFIRPAILDQDQFAFKPTGSTTCALVCLQHHVTRLLETNMYVRCLVIDFSKAFDTIDHAILLSKLSSFSIPNRVLNWIIDFLMDRQQQCKLGVKLSSPVSINRSIIQGSGIGPSLYVVMKSDLTTLGSRNIVIKYADDVDLLVPEVSDVDITAEFNHLKHWANINKMCINFSKTKELVFHRPNPRNIIYPSAVDDIEQVTVAKLLGVIVQSNLSCDEHVDYILKLCNQRVYLLKLLKARGLHRTQLHHVCQAVIISRILYALPAWGGSLTASSKHRIDGFFRRLYRCDYTDLEFSIEQLLGNADSTLFRKILSTGHCLHHLLPPVKNVYMSLRPNIHNCHLPICNYEPFKRSYIVRCLFKV